MAHVAHPPGTTLGTKCPGQVVRVQPGLRTETIVAETTIAETTKVDTTVVDTTVVETTVVETTVVENPNGSVTAKPTSVLHAGLLLFLVTLGWGGCNIVVMLAVRLDPNIPFLTQLSALVAGKWAALLVSHRGLRGILPEVPKTKDIPTTLAILHSSLSATAFCLYGLAILSSKGGAALTAMTQLHAGVPILFAAIVLKEPINVYKAFGIATILLGVCVLGYDGSGSGDIKWAGAALIGVCIVIWGVTFTVATVYQKYHDKASFVTANYFGSVVATTLAAIANVFMWLGKREIGSLNAPVVMLFFSQFLNEPFMLVYSSLGKQIDSTILSPVAQLFNIYPIAFAILFYHEEITMFKTIGCFLTVLGAVILGLVKKKAGATSMAGKNVVPRAMV